MLFQEFNISLEIEPIICITVLIFQLLLSIYFYKKIRIFMLISVNYIFSIIITITSFQYNIPFSPYIQIFILLIQSVLFLETMLEVLSK